MDLAFTFPRSMRVLLVGLGLAAIAHAQIVATITGRGSNVSPRQGLDDVQVTLLPLGASTATGRDGGFARNVPPGEYPISARVGPCHRRVPLADPAALPLCAGVGEEPRSLQRGDRGRHQRPISRPRAWLAVFARRQVC